MTNWDQRKRSEVTAPLITPPPIRVFSWWLCQTSCIHLTVPNGTSISHGAALGSATQDDNNERRECNFDEEEVFSFHFDVFPVLFELVWFLTATDPRYNPQQKHLPSRALTLTRASWEQHSPNSANTHPISGITLVSWAPRASQGSPAGTAAVPTTTHTTPHAQLLRP